MEETKKEKLAKNNQGFLLIALLLAVAIIGIIFAVYHSKRIKNAQTQKKAVEQQLQNSIEDIQKKIEMPQELSTE